MLNFALNNLKLLHVESCLFVLCFFENKGLVTWRVID